jgi:hypothetical protein
MRVNYPASQDQVLAVVHCLVHAVATLASFPKGATAFSPRFPCPSPGLTENVRYSFLAAVGKVSLWPSLSKIFSVPGGTKGSLSDYAG